MLSPFFCSTQNFGFISSSKQGREALLFFYVSGGGGSEGRCRAWGWGSRRAAPRVGAAFSPPPSPTPRGGGFMEGAAHPPPAGCAGLLASAAWRQRCWGSVLGMGFLENSAARGAAFPPPPTPAPRGGDFREGAAHPPPAGYVGLAASAAAQRCWGVLGMDTGCMAAAVLRFCAGGVFWGWAPGDVYNYDHWEECWGIILGWGSRRDGRAFYQHFSPEFP